MTNNEAIEVITHFDKHITPCDEYGYRIDSDLMEAHLMAAKALGNGWIPVTERLPEHCVTVLSYDGRHYRNVKTDSYDHCFECWLSDMDNVLGSNTVTHWMPLPEPPQEVKCYD